MSEMFSEGELQGTEHCGGRATKWGPATFRGHNGAVIEFSQSVESYKIIDN